MFDVIFISFDELNADENWAKLKEIAPHAKRVHGVKGIDNAHIKAASISTTSHFFTVDGDNVVDESFNWDRVVDFQKNDQRIHVWRCQNAVNGLVYGYGGVKLWPREHVEHIKKFQVDFTTSVATHGFKIQSSTASVTHFNTSEYNAWKSGFRECTKLSSKIIKNHDSRSENRLRVWNSVGIDAHFGLWALLGARMGTLFGIEYQEDEKQLSKINDFTWCREQFDKLDNSLCIEFYEKAKIELEKYDFYVPNVSIEESRFWRKVIAGGV